MSSPPPKSDAPQPVLGYADPSHTPVTGATTAAGVAATAGCVLIACCVVFIAYEVIDVYRGAKLTNQQSVDRALVILARPSTFRRPEFAGGWWVTLAMGACVAWSAAVIWAGLAGLHAMRARRWAVPTLRMRVWGLAGVAAVAALVLQAYAAHIRRVFGDWDLLGDFLYRDTGPLTFVTSVAAAGSILLALWINGRHRRIARETPHSIRP